MVQIVGFRAKTPRSKKNCYHNCYQITMDTLGRKGSFGMKQSNKKFQYTHKVEKSFTNGSVN